MITLNELLCGNKLEEQSAEIQKNLQILLERINKIRSAWNKSMKITSGLRSLAHHINVYKDLAKQRGQLFDQTKIPMGSQHLKGNAGDVLDRDGSLFNWCKTNEKLLEEIGLWCEDKDDQPRVHFQTVPPKSGKRFFKP